MAWSEINSQPTVGRRWNARFALKTLFLIASTCLFSVAETATLPRLSLERRASIADGVELRVLPIGEYVSRSYYYPSFQQRSSLRRAVHS